MNSNVIITKNRRRVFFVDALFRANAPFLAGKIAPGLLRLLPPQLRHVGQDSRQMLDTGPALRIGVRAEQGLELRLQAHRFVARRCDRQIFQVSAADGILAGNHDAAASGAVERQVALIEDSEYLIDR